MSLNQVSEVCAKMNDTTEEFLKELSSKLNRVFSAEDTENYLLGMVDHLKTYYRDVFNELEKKHADIALEIEELHNEHEDLQRALNTEIDFRPEDGLPLKVLKERLDQQLVSMRNMYKEKHDIIDQCLLEQQPLIDELGEDPRILSLNPLATDAEVEDFKIYLADLKEERIHRLDKIADLQDKIRIISIEIEIDLNKTLLTALAPTKPNIQRLENELEYLEKKRSSIKAECEQMLEKLQILWECLECPEYFREQYTQMAQQCTQTAIDSLSDELKRCKLLKQENMKSFINNIRLQIVAMWDKCYKSENERNLFRVMHSDAYSEDLLTLHEYELEECKRFYSENEKIFQLLIERNNWWERKKALDAKQNEPNRFNNRGGQLLKEEKERKIADAKIPKIEKEIEDLVKEYYEKTKRKFTINGECLVEMMDRDWENYRGSKELLKSARKVVPTPSHAKTPKTPMSTRAQISMKRIASTTNLAMSTGNMAKRRHLEVPAHGFNITSSKKKTNISSTYAVKQNTKRNLLSQLNDQSQIFTQPRQVISHKKTPSQSRKSITNVAASKVVKKYRRSSKLHVRVSSTDESLLNYDVFETQAKPLANSSIIELQENAGARGRAYGSNINVRKTPMKTVNHATRKSPLKPANFTQLKATKTIDI